MIFDGKAFAQKKENQLLPKVASLTKKLGRKPKLLAVGIGSEEDIAMYLSLKEKAAQRLGIDFEKKIFSDQETENTISYYLKEKSADNTVDSILLELPLPKQFSTVDLLKNINPLKDHDGITPENLGLLLLGKPRFYPATVKSIKDILVSYYGRPACRQAGASKFLAQKNAVVVGGGVELGKPLALILSDLGAAVSLCRSTTRDLSQFTKNADLIVSAAGQPGLIREGIVKEGIVIIDAGINFVNGKTAGDVDSGVQKKAAFFTPVPGGVGPVTIVSLFENMVESQLS